MIAGVQGQNGPDLVSLLFVQAEDDIEIFFKADNQFERAFDVFFLAFFGISQIEKSGKGRALFTSRDMPGLIPDLLVAQQSAIQNKRQDLIGMTRAWFDTVTFIQNNPDAAVKIMSKVVGMNPTDYKVFLPGTRFFDTAANLDGFNAASASSLVGVAPQIAAFLLANRLIDGKPDPAKGVDGSILAAALKK